MAAYASNIPETPPLENGDRLTRVEFERRYDAAPPGLKAELIEGVVYVASPVHMAHAQAHGAVTRWLAAFLANEPGLDMLIEPTVRLDADNEVQPDVVVVRTPIISDTSRFLTHPPALAIEVSASSVSYDLGVKMNVYRRNGVQEYVVWRVYDQAIDWFELKDGAYERLEGDERGVIESRVFPGLRLDVKALLAGEIATVLAELGR
jgi:Uma2 family endonuclease